jgi:hypothetical protein
MPGRLARGRAVALDAVPDRGRAHREAREELAVTARRGEGGEGRLREAQQPAEPERGVGGDRCRSGWGGGRSGHVHSWGDGGSRAAVT